MLTTALSSLTSMICVVVNMNDAREMSFQSSLVLLFEYQCGCFRRIEIHASIVKLMSLLELFYQLIVNQSLHSRESERYLSSSLTSLFGAMQCTRIRYS